MAALSKSMNSHHSEECFTVLLNVLQQTDNPTIIDVCRYTFEDTASRSDFQDVSDYVQTILSIISESSSSNAKDAACEAFVAIEPWVQAEIIEKALVAFLSFHQDKLFGGRADAIAAISPRLSQQQAKNALDSLIQDVQIHDLCSNESSVKALVSLAQKSGPEGQATLGDAIIAYLEEVAHNLEKLAFVLTRDREARFLEATSSGLITIVRSLTADQQERWINALTLLLHNGNSYATEKSLSGVKSLLPEVDADVRTRIATSRLVSILTRRNTYQYYEIQLCYEFLGKELTSGQFDEAFKFELQQLYDEPNEQRPFEGLKQLAPNMNSEQVRRTCDAICSLFSRIGVYQDISLAKLLSSLGSRASSLGVKTNLGTLIVQMVEDEALDRIDDKDARIMVTRHLSDREVAFLFSKLTKSFEKSAGDYRRSTMEWLLAIEPQLTKTQCQQTSLSLLATLPEMPVEEISSATTTIAKFCRRLDQDVRERIVAKAMSTALDAFASLRFLGNDEYHQMLYLRDTSLCLSNAKSVAELLKHPSCVSEIREMLLARFEELILHDGKGLFFHAPARGLSGLHEWTHDSIDRKFKSIYDAAEWIEKNWPDFDLEATPQVSHRPTRN